MLVSLENQGNAEGDIILGRKKMFSDIKSDFSRILLDSKG